jgi:hypothetical protein
MPSIKEMQGANLKGYTPSPAPQPPVVAQTITGDRLKANPSIRCPLPPFNSDPDTLRQFENGTLSPKIRVLPLPPNSGSGGGATTIVNNISTSGSSGGGTSTNTTTTLVASSVTPVTGLLIAGGVFTGTVQLAKSFQLLSISASAPCEVRLYGTAAAQAFDAARPLDAPVPPEVMSNLIVDVVLDTLPYFWPLQNITGANQDTPQSKTLYMSVFNLAGVPETNISVTIAYVPMEN